MASVRTQIYLEEEQRRQLRRVCAARGTSMAEVVREAVSEFLAHRSGEALPAAWQRAAGLWADRDDIEDGVTYTRELREQWEARRLRG
ncbi:MAG: CopG family transcriptional regulator [Actinomycetota bacterium]